MINRAVLVESCLIIIIIIRRKYGAACQARRASFTPLCFFVDGLFGSEADYFLRRLADSLSVKWEKNYSVVMGYVRARLS